MTVKSDAVLTVKGADGTSDRTFHATGVAERWYSTEAEEQDDVFTKDKFEKALKKVSRKVKK